MCVIKDKLYASFRYVHKIEMLWLYHLHSLNVSCYWKICILCNYLQHLRNTEKKSVLERKRLASSKSQIVSRQIAVAEVSMRFHPYARIFECLVLRRWTVYEKLGGIVLLKEVGHWVLTLRFRNPMQGKVLFSWFLLPENHDGRCKVLPNTSSVCYHNASHHEDHYWHTETVNKPVTKCFLL